MGQLNKCALDRIIGYEDIRNELEQIVDTLRNKEAYSRLDVTSPCGLLLYGEPGLGKTLMAKCLIEDSGLKSYIIRKDQHNGAFMDKIKATFEEAALHAPSIVFMDDMDKFANEDSRRCDAEEYVAVQAGIDDVKGKGVFALATVNNIRKLPESLIREGRFDRRIEVSAPSVDDASRIIEYYLRGKKTVASLDTFEIASLMPGRSCATLESIVNEAGLFAGYSRAVAIGREHFINAILRVIYHIPYGDLLRRTVTGNASSGRDKTIAYHEAGHAVVAEALKEGSVSLTSIYAKGDCSGFTITSLEGNVRRRVHYEYDYEDDEEYTYITEEKARKDTEDNNVDMKRVLEDELLCALSGMAAVEYTFDTKGIGCSDDLEKAFDIMKYMINKECLYGFGLYKDDPRKEKASESLVERTEALAGAEMDKYYQQAKKIIAANSDLLNRIAAELQKRKVLTASDIREIRQDLDKQKLDKQVLGNMEIAS